MAELEDAPDLESGGKALRSSRAGSNPAYRIQQFECTAKERKMSRVPRTADNIHIPLKTNEAISLLLRVKPTADMPRPGANPTKAKKKRAKKAK